MNIGIITYHRAVNPGAFLQSYAIRKILQQNGHKVKIIEHNTTRTLKKEFISHFYRNKGLRRISEFATIFRYISWQDKYLNTSLLWTDDSLITINSLDALILGSDEIWNYENFFFGLTPLFFGVGINEPKIVSYAPSFGSISIDKELPEIVKDSLSKINHLSVRDYHSQSIIEKYFGFKPFLALDPTLLYDFEPESVMSLAEDNILLVYATAVSEQDRQGIVKFAQKNRLKIVSILFFYGWADKCYTHLSPFEILGWFKKAKYVFTNTFHGTLFSLKFSDNFAVRIGEGKTEKINTIIKLFSLEDCIVKHDIISVFTQTQTSLQMKVKERLNQKKVESINFLLSCLSS